MPKPKNDATRNIVFKCYNELKSSQTVGDSSLPRRISEETGIAYPMVCYYLRGGNKSKNRADGRKKYTHREVSNLALMTVHEKRDYADHRGKTIRAMYALVKRKRDDMRYYLLTSEFAIECALADIKKAGHMDISNLAHLQASGLTQEQVDEAARVLQPLYNLSLRAPNILYHKPSGRRYYMDATEQRMMLHNPKHFLSQTAKKIKENWVDTDCDPVYDELLEEDAHEKELAKASARRRRQQLEEKKVLTAIAVITANPTTKCPVVQNSELCTKLQTLVLWAQKQLDNSVSDTVDEIKGGSDDR